MPPRESLYHYPEVYGTLLTPEPDLLDDLRWWEEDYADAPVRMVMDPACGPGTFLLPYTEEDCHLGGFLGHCRECVASELLRGILVSPHCCGMQDWWGSK